MNKFQKKKPIKIRLKIKKKKKLFVTFGHWSISAPLDSFISETTRARTNLFEQYSQEFHKKSKEKSTIKI